MFRQELNKILILLSVAIFLVVAIVLLSFYNNSKPATTNRGESFNTQEDVELSKSPQTTFLSGFKKLVSTEKKDASTTTATQTYSSEKQIQVMYHKPVSSAYLVVDSKEVTTLAVVEQKTGRVIYISIKSGEQPKHTVMLDKLIPFAKRSILADGVVVMEYFKEGVLKTVLNHFPDKNAKPIFLPDNILDLAVSNNQIYFTRKIDTSSFLYTFSLDTNKQQSSTKLPMLFAQIIPIKDTNKIIVSSKPSTTDSSLAYLLDTDDKTKNSLILFDKKHLQIKPISKSEILFSYKAEDGQNKLGWQNLDTQEKKEFDLSTFAFKCSDKYDKYVFCFKAKTRIPDLPNWVMNEHSDDELVKLDLNTGLTEVIYPTLSDDDSILIDADSVIISESANAIYFINKYDNKVYKISIN